MFDDDLSGSMGVEGEMTISSSKKATTSQAGPGAPDYNTLDEPIKETIVIQHLLCVTFNVN